MPVLVSLFGMVYDGTLKIAVMAYLSFWLSLCGRNDKAKIRVKSAALKSGQE